MANDSETYTIEIVPAQGNSTTKTVNIPATGTSVGEALKAAGIDHRGMELSIDGRPVTVDHHIKPSQKLSTKSAKQVKKERREESRRITATERASGS